MWLSFNFQLNPSYYLFVRIFFSNPKMKIFTIIQSQLATLGISPSNQSTRKCPFSRRVLFGFFLSGCCFVSLFGYIFHVANDFMDYVSCICATSGIIIIFVCFVAIVYRRTTLFDSIERLEKLIETSKTILCSNSWVVTPTMQDEIWNYLF